MTIKLSKGPYKFEVLENYIRVEWIDPKEFQNAFMKWIGEILVIMFHAFTLKHLSI